MLSRGVLHACGPYRLRERAGDRPRGHDQHAAERRVPGLRRAADPVRNGSPDGAGGRGPRARPGARPRGQRPSRGRYDRHRPANRQGRQRAAGPACRLPGGPVSGAGARRSRARTAASAWRSSSTARASRAPARSGWLHGPRWNSRRAARGSASLTPRSGRAPGRCSRRSWPTSSGCRSMPSRSRRLTPLACLTAGRLSLRERCMVVGGLLQRCARDLKRRLGGMTPGDYLRTRGPLVVTKQYEPPPGISFDEETYRGDAYGTYAWACDVAEVELDPVTYEVRPVSYDGCPGVRQADQPGAGRRADRGRHGAGHRLRPARGGRHARRAHGERAADELPSCRRRWTRRQSTW